jgi:hypothetical protein
MSLKLVNAIPAALLAASSRLSENKIVLEAAAVSPTD